MQKLDHIFISPKMDELLERRWIKEITYIDDVNFNLTPPNNTKAFTDHSGIKLKKQLIHNLKIISILHCKIIYYL